MMRHGAVFIFEANRHFRGTLDIKGECINIYISLCQWAMGNWRPLVKLISIFLSALFFFLPTQTRYIYWENPETIE